MASTPPSRTERIRQRLLWALATVWVAGGTLFIVGMEMREAGEGAPPSGFALRLGALLLQLLVAVSATALLFWNRNRRSAERAASQRAEEFRQLFHDASEAMFVVDSAIRLVEINAAACRLIGFSRAELVGRPLISLVPAPELAARPMNLEALLSGQRVVSERTLVRKDGTQLIGEVAVQQLPDGRILGVVRDVSTRRATEQRLRLLSRALEVSPAAMVITDLAGQIGYVNPRFCAVTGWSAAEAIGKTPAILKSGSTAEAIYRDLWSAIRAGAIWQGELINRRKNGELFPWLLSIHPILDEQGRIEHYLGVGEDASERRTVEHTLEETRAQLQQAQKMEALGRLAGGVAHDFNNLLGVILGYSDLLGATVAEHSEGSEQLGEIRKAVLRASDLTRQLLAFSRRQVLTVRVVALVALLEDSRRMLERLLPESIELRLDAVPELWPVRADATQLVQVLVNLAVNSRDAMPLGGQLGIEARNFTFDSSQAAEHGLAAADYVRLQVHDTGTGMTGDVLAHAFEPFFTTKATGGGTGLGLATVYGIVQQMGGRAEIDSQPDRGTTVTIYLPRSLDRPSGETAISPALLGQRAEANILVVEDLAPLRKLVERMLLQIGYRVFSAGSAQEAMAVIEAAGVEIDLLLSDIVMPGMDGRDFARLLKAARPKLRVVLMTGYSDLFADLSDFSELGADAVIQKPFSRAQIERTLAEVLARAEERGEVS